jgi:transglutaminase-like putative cysteine protease
MYFNTSAPEVIRLLGDYLSQHNAVQQLVRPWEVQHLIIRRAPTITERILKTTFAEKTAQWLTGKLTSGEFSYIADPNGFLDYWCAPAFTLRRNGGDCEDFTLLTVSMLAAGGVSANVAIGTAWNGSFFGGHAWVEGMDSKGFFLIEGTSGQLYRNRPPQYRLSWNIEHNQVRRAA